MGSKDETSFKTLDHVSNYPIVSDGIDAVKANPYGKKALEIGDSAVQGVLNTAGPVLRKPYDYAEPLMKKADELAVSSLQQFDERVPILKKDSQTVIKTGKSYVFWPYDYATGVWNEEYHNAVRGSDGNKNLWVLIQTIISAMLHVAKDCSNLTGEIIQWFREVVMPKVKEVQKKSPDYVRQAQEAAGQYKQSGQEKVGGYTTSAQQKSEEFMSQAQDSADSTSRQAQQTAKEAKGSAQQTADQAKYQAQQTKEDAKAKTGSK